MPVAREYIISEIRRTTAENDGKPLGRARFMGLTGIRERECESYWSRWGDAVEEAGFERNAMTGRYSDDHLLDLLAQQTRRLGHPRRTATITCNTSPIEPASPMPRYSTAGGQPRSCLA